MKQYNQYKVVLTYLIYSLNNEYLKLFCVKRLHHVVLSAFEFAKFNITKMKR